MAAGLLLNSATCAELSVPGLACTILRMRLAATPRRRSWRTSESARAAARLAFSPFFTRPVMVASMLVSWAMRLLISSSAIVPVFGIEVPLVKAMRWGTLRVSGKRPAFIPCCTRASRAGVAALTTEPCTRWSHWYLAWLSAKYFFRPTVSSMALLHTFSSINWKSRMPSRYSFTSMR